MLESLVRGALKQRLVVCVIAVVLLFFGLNAATKLSVDAFPDVTNVQVVQHICSVRSSGLKRIPGSSG